MRILRSAAHAGLSAAISGGAFGLMAILFLMVPQTDEPYSIEAGPEREVVYEADVTALLESMAAEAVAEAAVEEAEPVVEEEPAGEPIAEPLAEAPAAEEPAAAPAPAVSERPAVATSTRLSRRQIAERHRVRREQAAAAATAAPSSGKKKRSCEEGTDAITALGNNRYEVERELVDYYTGDMQEAMGLASVYWYREDGEIVGFKVRRIKCGSVLHQAGIRNGDVVRTINGRKVTTIPQALSAYRKLRRKRRLEVVLTRRTGDTVSLRYKLT